MRNVKLRIVYLCAAIVIGVGSLPVALFGLAQLASTTADQLSGPAQITDFVAIYSGARQLTTEPGRLYTPGAVAAIDQSLTGTARFDRPFSFLPNAALLLAPLGAAPYGLAYLVWLVVGVVALGLSIWLLAPLRWLWPILLALFLPVQLALIMGQTPPLALLAFCGLVRLLSRRPILAGVLLGLSPVTWKPQLFLPTFTVALVAGRRWRTVATLLVAPALLSGAVLAVAGLHLIGDYQQQGAEMLTQVGSGRSVESAGQTLLGLCQAVFGPGSIAVALGVAGSVVVELAIGLMWWRGLRADGRRDLQFAALPIAAVLAAPHALGLRAHNLAGERLVVAALCPDPPHSNASGCLSLSDGLAHRQHHHPDRERHRFPVGRRPGRRHTGCHLVALPEP